MRNPNAVQARQVINRVLGFAERTENSAVQGYHSGGDWRDEESYAFGGFKSNKYFTSDRTMLLDQFFRRPDGKALKGYGLEIETECWGINNNKALAGVFTQIIFKCLPADLFKMERDASLTDGKSSAECITQVMTKDFIRNNYTGFKAMWQLMDMFEISASRSGNCGMHVNISNACFGTTEKTQEVAIRKLYYFINNNYSLACSLLRRDINRNGFCARMTQDAKTTPINEFKTGHRICFNWAHYNAGRIELRLVGGQKNYATFRNTMETIFHLVEACKHCSWNDMDDMTKVFSGCNQHVYDRLTLARNEGKITSEVVNAIHDTVVETEYNI